MTIRVGMLLIAGTLAGSTPDSAGDQVRRLLDRALPDGRVVHTLALDSDRHLVAETLRCWCDEEEIDLILTVGGTFPAPGPSPDEIVPEATAAVLDRGLPGLPEAMRSYAAVEAPLAFLDRGVAGIRSRSLIVNLPGDPALAALFLEGVSDLLEVVLARLGAPESAPVQEELVRPPKGLDPDEFARFVEQQRGSQGDG